jgi:putative aldouronate transport system substrate-binding protein
MGSGWQMGFDEEAGNKWLYGPVRPEFRYVLSYLARAYADGVLDPDFAVTTAQQWHEKNSNGSALFCWENMNFGFRWNLALQDLNPNYEWGPLETIAGEKGQRNRQYFGVVAGGFAMGGTTKHPERIIEMLDWMLTPEGLDLTNWGIEGEHYRYVKGSRPASITDYTDVGLSKALDYHNKEILPDVWKVFFEKTDPFRSYQSETGTGQLDFHVLVDKAINLQWETGGKYDWWYELTASDPGLRVPVLPPPFTPEEVDRIKTITTNVEALLVPAYDNVILGKMSLEEYDAVAKKAIAAGTPELERIYNEAEARLK